MREVIKNEKRVNGNLINFLFQYLIMNHIEFAEVEIFFSFMAPLVNVNSFLTSLNLQKYF